MLMKRRDLKKVLGASVLSEKFVDEVSPRSGRKTVTVVQNSVEMTFWTG
jgi:hypothetical protein